tara:strand:- start:148 stop:405 length:258 start_codon:yes stop_codon:yes gene_type:complete
MQVVTNRVCIFYLKNHRNSWIIGEIMSEKVVLFCRISKELKEALEVEAKNQHRSTSTLVEIICRKEMLVKAKRLEKLKRFAWNVS